jgi:S-adenosylmethionine/arginine decarboxylase-like enzyme
MKDLAPQIYRQRLLIEGYYPENVGRQQILGFFKTLTSALEVAAYTDPFISLSEGHGQRRNQGYEAFQPLIESGIALYTWNEDRFLSLIIYTCKAFSAEVATETTVRYFALDPFTSSQF